MRGGLGGDLQAGQGPKGIRMVTAIIISLMSLACVGQGEAKVDPRSTVDLIESLQSGVGDFRCAFEGTSATKSEEIKRERKLGKDGVYDTFSGMFIWRSNGDTYVNTLHRHEPDGKITREQLVIRAKKSEAEHYLRTDDSPIGRSAIEDSSRVNANRSGCYGAVFLVDQIRRMVAMKGIECSISEEQVDGRNLTVLSFSFQGSNQLYQRYWIDLQRGGHAVRREDYARGNVLVSRVDTRLAPFKVGDKDIWMPVSGRAEGHAALDKDHKPTFPKEPTMEEIIYVVDGTLRFNQNPGPDTFRASYKLGTPISDSLRKLEYEFGQQRIGSKPTKAEAEKMLEEQVSKAEEQKSELVVASTSEGFPWSTWLAWGLGAVVVVLSVVLWIQRRGH